MGLAVILKAYQAVADRAIIKEIELMFSDRNALCYTRPVIKIVIVTKSILIDYLIHHLTAFTTKNFVLQFDPGGNTFFATMGTKGLLTGVESR